MEYLVTLVETVIWPAVVLVIALAYKSKVGLVLEAITRRVTQGPVEFEGLGSVLRLPEPREPPGKGEE